MRRIPTRHPTPAPVLGLALCALALGAAAPAGAQDSGGTNGARVLLDGSAPPLAPATITRDSLGRATVRAIRLTEPLRLDGVLDEAVYQDNEPFGDFVAVTPVAGRPSSERTDVWITFDDENVYVTCRCWESAPPEEWIVNELRRDSDGLRNNEHFGVMFDTFYDRRSGSMFYANPLGGRADYSVVDEGRPNTDWNPVWDVRSGRFDGGWTVEMAIPFKSLRYRAGSGHLWGIQMRRSIRHKNEWTYLNPVPAVMAGPQALNRVSSGGTIVGLELPPAGSNLELKPYGIAGLSTNRLVDPQVSNDFTRDVGLDLKYGLTANLTADVTVNTDFAQVEVDEQQVNLTRFSLFFPEKRDFFLENRGVFDFGQGIPNFSGAGGFSGGGPGGFFGGGGDTPQLFYSRRIGLDRGEVVPIQAGGRVTGKVGKYAIGAINIQTDGVESAGIDGTNYSVFRLKRDVLRRSSIGAMFTNRSTAVRGPGANRAYGADMAFGFGESLTGSAYWARSETEGLDGDDASWQAKVDYAGDLVGVSGELLQVGSDFNPEIGFVRRTGFRKSSGSVRYSPRPASLESVRKLTWQATVDYFEDAAGRMESRSQEARFNVELESSDQISVQANRNFERLVQPFSLTPDLAIAPGSYAYTDFRASVTFGPQRWLSGSVSVNWGEFFDGSVLSIGVNRGRLVVSDRLSLDPGVSFNVIDLPQGESNQNVARLRADYAFTARMFASALMQYNTADDTFSSNLRFRWEYRPGSEIFVVWTDDRDTSRGGSGLRSRALAVKVTRLLRY